MGASVTLRTPRRVHKDTPESPRQVKRGENKGQSEEQ